MIDELRQKYLAFFQQRGHLVYPSASLATDDPTLLFTSAGMVQFKPYFLGATPKFAGFEGVWRRVTTCQKCLRVNDIENVGRTLRHHSFFEMLGNFSFGDYFKSEAAAWAWEFLTSPDWLGLDPERLYVTVYQDDDEAFRVWNQEVGVPAERISRWGEDENFWPANAITQGPNGPCGPCSEIFYDRGPEFGSEDETGPNTGSGDRFVEVWNLVFTQFDRQDGGVLEPLPQKNIDTGLGFERLVAVMTGSVDAYGTELFQPTIRRVAELSGQPYLGPESVSHRVIADHLRAVAFAITDGILPANDGPGYVIKMLLRRASRHAWLLGLRRPVLFELVDQVVEAMGSAYPALADGRDRVKGVIRAEEEQFLRTLESGLGRVRALLDELDGRELPGDVAFDLWQTYGFPLDLTVELAAERGVGVDRAGFDAAREEARVASRGARTGGTLFAAGSDTLGRIASEHGETAYLGAAALDAEARVLALIADDEAVPALAEGASALVVLDRTPFYPEGGGQVGDTGKLEWPGGAALVKDTTRSQQGLVLHRVTVVRGRLEPGVTVRAVVDPARLETEKHHTATHLLHAALRSVLGTHVAQAGSLVAPDRLRFDFTHPHAPTSEELARVETLVNRWIQADLPVEWAVVPMSTAREAGAMMLFGEKYGDEVRMVTVGAGLPARAAPAATGSARASGGPAADGPVATGGAVSIELCGGTHVRRTGELGSLVITVDEAVSAGVRRLEAKAGMAALEHHQAQRAALANAARLLGTAPDEFEERLTRLQQDLKSAQREIKSLRDRLAAAQTSGGAQPAELAEAGGLRYLTTVLEDLDAPALRNAADTLLQRSGADLVLVASGGLLVAKTTEAARKRGAHAGNIVREVAQRAGGNGGGRPDLAQAGVKDPARVADALAAVPEILSAQLAS